MVLAMSHITSTVLSVLVTAICVVNSSQQHHWVDPDGDIIPTHEARLHRESWEDPDFTRSTVKTEPTAESDREKVDVTTHLRDIQTKLSTCQLSLDYLRGSITTSNQVQDSPVSSVKEEPNDRASTMKTIEAMYMRRFVGILLRVSRLSDATFEPGESKRSNIVVDISKEQLATLRGFVDNAATTLEEINEVLSEVFTSEAGYYIPLGWLERIANFFAASEVWTPLAPYATSVLVLVLVFYRWRLREIITTSIIVILALGYQATYQHMLKLAEIKQLMALHKYDSIPESCRPSDSWSPWVAMSRWLAGDHGDCQQYFEAQMMPPAMAVTPTVVLAEMFATLISHPSGKLGQAFGDFSHGVLGSLSFLQGLFVLPLVMIVILLGVVLLSGGRIRLPFYLGGAELAGRTSVPGRRSSSPREIPNSPANLDDRIRAISRDELLIHRIVQQLAPLTDRTERVEDVNSTSQVRRLTSRTQDNLIDLVDVESVPLGRLIDVSANSQADSLVLVQAAIETNVSRVEEVRMTTQDDGSFLDSLQMILDEESTSRSGGSDVSAANSEFMTSIETIMMDSSAELTDCSGSEVKCDGS